MLPINSEYWACSSMFVTEVLILLKLTFLHRPSQSENHMKNVVEVCKWVYWEVIYLSREGANLFPAFVWKLMGLFHR